MNLIEPSRQLAKLLLQKSLKVTSAESCTGGLVAKALTDIAGSSAWFDSGFVTYSNHAKHCMLAVEPDVIERQGAVSSAVVEAMANGALGNSAAQLSVAISGVAGPGGGTETNPVGSVWLAWANDRSCTSQYFQFEGDRQQIREAAARAAIVGLIALAEIS